MIDANVSTGELTASVPDLLHILSESLYRQPEVFLRELCANSFDALLRRFGSPHTSAELPAIRIVCVDHRTLAVEDHGIGMTRTELEKFLSCIGSSASRLARASGVATIGRFGMGFLSVLAVAERVWVFTGAEREGKKESWQWSWQATDRTHFLIQPEPPRAVGTSVVVQLKERLRRLADFAVLSEQLQIHLPFLPVQLRLSAKSSEPGSEPRAWLPPWLYAKAGTRWRFTADQKPPFLGGFPTYCFSAKLPNGAGVVIGVPAGVPDEPHGVTLCQQGILVAQQLDGVLPWRWRWLYAFIDSVGTNLALDREGVLADENLQQLQVELEALLQDEFVYLATHDSGALRRIFQLHRGHLCTLLLNSGALRERLGGAYLHQTTLGELSVTDIITSVEKERELRVLVSSPLADMRWATARAQGLLIVRCHDEDELALLRAQLPNSVVIYQLDFSATYYIGRRAPPVPVELQSWFATIRDYLGKHRVLVEPARLLTDDLVAVAELPVRDTLTEGSGGEKRLQASLGRMMNALLGDTASEHASGRLMLNLASSRCRALARLAPEGCPTELQATLLFVSGALRSGVPVPPQWTALLEQLTDHGVAALTKQRQAALAPRGHSVCFFAHEYNPRNLRLRRLLRQLLEHEPYFWEVSSADELTKDEKLFANVEKHLQESQVVLCEVTHYNKNVMFELGMAIGMKLPSVFLFAERGFNVDAADLRERLIFYYDAQALINGDAAGVTARETELLRRLQDFLATVPDLNRVRGHQPFLGYRLLREAQLITQSEQAALERVLGDPKNLLSERLDHLAGQIGIPRQRLQAMTDYFRQRLERFAAINGPPVLPEQRRGA